MGLTAFLVPLVGGAGIGAVIARWADVVAWLSSFMPEPEWEPPVRRHRQSREQPCHVRRSRTWSYFDQDADQ